MNVTLTPEPAFTVSNGHAAIPGMRLVSEWEGFAKLQGAKGFLIVARGRGPFGGVFSGTFEAIFGKDGEGGEAARIIAGSPELLDILQQPNEAKQ